MPPPLNLLLVEDSENDFRLLVQALERSALAVAARRVATDPELRAALGQLSWDVILCDANLPGLGGPTVLDIVKKHDPDLPVIMISAGGGEEMAVELLHAGAGDYLSKDNLVRLAPTIERELAAREERQARRRADAALQTGNRRLALLSQLAERLLAAPAPVDVASAAFDTIAGELDLHAYFHLCVEANGDVRLESWGGIPGQVARRISRLKSGEALCGLVVQSGEAWHATDIQKTGDKQVELLRRHGLQAYFCSPLKMGERLFGALAFGTRSRPRFSAEDLDFMCTVVCYVALLDERLPGEKALRRSERHFRQFAESMPQLIWSARPDGTVDYYNERRKAFAGFSQKSDGVWSWAAALHPDDLERTQAAWEHAIRTASPYQIEHRVQRADGSFGWLLSRATPIRDEAGAIVKWYGAATDIDYLKRTEAALRDSEERFRAFFENAAVGLAEMDRDALFLQVNDRFCQITGYRREALLGRTPHELTHPDEREKEEEGFRKILAGEAENLEMEKQYVNKDGGSIWVQENTTAMRDATGGIGKLFLLVQDITKRKAAVMERDRLLAQLEGTIHSIANAVIIYDFAGAIVRMNPATERMLQYSPEMAAKPIGERLAALRPETADELPYPQERHPALRALRGETILAEVMVYHPPQTERALWLAVSAAPIRTADGKILGAVSTMTDLTELHELQQERDLYVHTISHDLRTPLSVILGHAELLEPICRTDDAQKHIAAITAGAQRMERMIGDMVEAARVQGDNITLEKKAVRLEVFLCDLLARASAALDTARLVIDVPADLPPVHADPDRLERILVNLLSNALKYSSSASPVALTARSAGAEVVISVRDYGQGIASRDLPHIFRRFYRPRKGRKADSVGLGLHIVRSLVEAHGGSIRVESEPGAGSTFTFTLPVHPPIPP
ncbi:MAG: PAS domain S-box protein [Desulfuromonadales bacterium]